MLSRRTKAGSFKLYRRIYRNNKNNNNNNEKKKAEKINLKKQE